MIVFIIDHPLNSEDADANKGFNFLLHFSDNVNEK